MTFVRSAQIEDIKFLLAFEKEIINHERSIDDSLKATKFHYYDLLELIRSPKSQVLVAIVNEEIVGSGYAKIIPGKTYEKKEAYGYVGFMYVKPANRRQGINQKIVGQLLAWLKEKKIDEVRLNVYDKNTIAKKTYLKMGFESSVLEMRKKL